MSLDFNGMEYDERIKVQVTSDVSKVNKYSMESSLTETNPVTMDHNRRLINEIIYNVFDEKRGTCDMSSSQCSSMKLQPSVYSYDKRLEYWKNVLKEREKLSFKIQAQAKKNHSEILYNRVVTVNERDKFTVKNILDCAQRLNPTSLSARQPSALKEKCDAEKSILIPELQETLPHMERNKTAEIEIIGIPKGVQRELLGKLKCQGVTQPNSWLNSKYLENCVEEKRSDIERILEHYPDIENLEIVGKGLCHTSATKCKQNSDIEVISCDDIFKVSTDTRTEGDVCEATELVEYGFKINDQEFLIKNYRSQRNFQTLTDFSCYPFETEVKKIFAIQNIGRKVLDFEWVNRPFYVKNFALCQCRDNEFVFDSLPFRLCSGETREIFVKYQPRRVNVVKSKWILKVKPLMFKRKMDGIVMSLCGVCSVPPEYEQRLEEIQREVIEKSNRKMVVKLTTNLANLAVDLPVECSCPIQLPLNEMEVFEQLNPGFKCERYNDLELLKDLHQRTKKPRDKIWDLQVDTLKGCILKLPQATDRALLFNELSDILSSMKGKSVDLETKIFDNTERQRSRFLYVRGIVSTAIDEWVDLVSTLEETFYQTTLQVISDEQHLKTAENKYGKEKIKNVTNLPQQESDRRQYVVESRVRKLKSYRDAIYIQTYSLLCDFVENIVNVIESAV